MLHVVIMAGGAGTRFWPESRAARPKQLLPLAGPRTMLQATCDRLEKLAPPENIWVLTAAPLLEAVAKQLPSIAAKQIIGEPCKRDTAPCIGLAAMLVSESDPAAIMAVMPADQVIDPPERFQSAIRAAVALVEQNPQQIVTFGIRPTYPATGFGYIERGDPLTPSPSQGEGRGEGAGAAQGEGAGLLIFHVARFREKPPVEVAEEYVASGRFYWNSGIFIWRASTILAALRERQPEMYAHLEKIAQARGRGDADKVFAAEFAAIRGISIDYAVMEHARDIAVVEAPFTWDDVGTWQSTARLSTVDADGNAIVGRHLGLDTRNSIIRTTDDHLVATLGVSDLIVVHTPDATLVASRRDEESIRRLVKLLEERGWTEYL